MDHDAGGSDVSLPKATVVKLIRDFLPGEMRVAGETTDLLIACCTEFVQLVGSEANAVAGREGKKTIQPEHVLRALADLGFEAYVPECEAALDVFKEEARVSSSQKAALRKTGADVAGLSQAEQIALQQQMFAAARAASLTTADTAAVMAAEYQAAQQQAAAAAAVIQQPQHAGPHGGGGSGSGN